MAAKKPATKRVPGEKKPSLDIKDEMYWSDKKRFDWLDEQTPEMAKTFSALIAMKWFSVVDGATAEYHILMANELLNLGFWELSKYPDLQWRLMCAAGSGVSQRHGWVPMASSRKSVGKLDKVLLGLHPHLSDEELALMKSKMSRDEIKQLLLDLGLTDAEIKPLVEEFKKHYG